MRYVLRPDIGRQAANVRNCLPEPALAYVRTEEIAARREKPSNVFHFGNQTITTQVYMMVPEGADAETVDITEFMWEKANA